MESTGGGYVCNGVRGSFKCSITSWDRNGVSLFFSPLSLTFNLIETSIPEKSDHDRRTSRRARDGTSPDPARISDRHQNVGRRNIHKSERGLRSLSCNAKCRLQSNLMMSSRQCSSSRPIQQRIVDTSPPV